MSAQPKTSSLLTGLLCLFLQQALPAQQMTVRHYGVADGLTNEWISDFAQDSAGFIWMATQYGINRFDGRSFRSYTYRPDETSGPPANFAKCLLLSNQQRLWLGTLGRGLNRMHTRAETFDSPDETLGWPEFGIVDALFKAPNGNHYLATAKGIHVQDSLGRAPRRILPDRALCFAALPDGSVVSGGKTGIYRVSAEAPSLLNDLPVRALQSLSPDSLLALSGDELRLLVRRNGRWALDAWRFTVSTANSPFFTPRFARGPEKFWLAAGPRVWSFGHSLTDLQEQFPQTILGQEFSGIQVHVIFFDQEGDMWWGTNLGAFLLRPALAFQEPMQQWAPELPQAVREVIRVNEDYWLATSAGVFRLPVDGGLQRVSSSSVNALHYDRKGFVYTVEKGALVRFHAASGRRDLDFRPVGEQEGARQCWHITEDRRGRILIGRWNYLARYDPVTNDITNFQFTERDSSGALGILDLAVDQDDGLWVCTLHQGAMRVENISAARPGQALEYQKFRHDNNEEGSLSSDLAMQVHQTADGTIWITTDGGLNRFRPATRDFQRFLRGPGLPDDKFVSISSGPDSDLWLGSISHGILHFDPTTERFTTYDTDDGLRSNAMLISSVFRQEDGGLWFGGQNGLQFFRPEVIKARTQVQSPFLSWLSYHRYRTDTTLAEQLPLEGQTEQSPLIISPADNVVSWAFAAVSFRSPETTDYHFKLEGYHNDWLPPTKTGELTLSNIPSGCYVLRAKATNAAAGWTSEHAPVYLRVLPPWYQSFYAYVLYGLLLLGFLYGLYRTLLLRRLSAERMGWFERIAHEFRTPLAIIAGAADRSQRGPEPERADQLQLIERQTHLLGGQVDRILELARLRASPTPPETMVADFTAFHRYLLQSHASLAEEGGVELQFTAPEQPLRFSFAEDDWRAITGNLLSNALKFTPSGGRVSLSLRTEAGRGETERVVLTLTDTGKGMSRAFLRRLFRPFSREDEGITNGTGLGLALAKETADRIGAKVTVESEVGRGSTFTVVLPDVRRRAQTLPLTNLAPAAAPEDSAVVNDERPLILVAEDHPELVAYLRYCLADGYRLLTAPDGLTAWSLAQEQVPDLVLTDVAMPGISGLELTSRMANDPATDHVPVVMLTASSGDEARLKGLKAGAEAYLTKPFRRPELLTLVEGILARRARLRARYQAPEPTEKAPPNPFVLAAEKAVTERLADEDFSVADLAAAVFLERTQLFRKLKTLTGLTPTLFIRRIRLQQAKVALREPGITVAQVAYAHGFRDPAYFSRVFREEFGLTPSDSRE